MSENYYEKQLDLINFPGEHGQIVSEDSIRDLLADLGHLCDREGLNFAAVIDTAKKDWRSER